MLLLWLEIKPSLAPGWLQHWLFWLARGKGRCTPTSRSPKHGGCSWTMREPALPYPPGGAPSVCPTWGEGIAAARLGPAAPEAFPWLPSGDELIFSLFRWKQLQGKSANSSAQSPRPGCAPKCRMNKRDSQLGRLLITWWKHFLIMQQAALNNLLEKT